MGDVVGRGIKLLLLGTCGLLLEAGRRGFADLLQRVDSGESQTATGIAEEVFVRMGVSFSSETIPYLARMEFHFGFY